MKEANVMQFVEVEALVAALIPIITQTVEASLKRDLQEKLLTVNEACKLFQPAISRPTLDKYADDGLFKRYYVGDRPYFKYSEIINSAKTHSRYKRTPIH